MRGVCVTQLDHQPHLAILEVIWPEHSSVNRVLGPTIVFISQRFLDVFQQGFQYHGGVPIDGIHQYSLEFCKVSYACVVSASAPLYTLFTNKLAATGNTLKPQKSSELTLSNHALSSNILTSPPRPINPTFTKLSFHVLPQNTDCDNQAQEPGSEGRKKDVC